MGTSTGFGTRVLTTGREEARADKDVERFSDGDAGDGDDDAEDTGGGVGNGVTTGAGIAGDAVFEGEAEGNGVR